MPVRDRVALAERRTRRVARMPLQRSTLQMMDALRHPIRAKMLTMLAANGEMSPVAIARELDESVQLISYHMRILRDAGLVKLVGTTPRRGAVEHHYKLNPKTAKILSSAASEMDKMADLLKAAA